MKPNYIIFFDNDGVTSNWATWNNDTIFNKQNLHLSQIDIYKWNKIDQVCRNLNDNVDVHAVCISSWKYVFDNAKNRNKLKKCAGFQKIKVLHDKKCIEPDKLSYNEPWIRIGTVKKYLAKYKPIDYIILDDEFTRTYNVEKLKHIQTDMYDGLNYETFCKLTAIIRQWPDIKESAKQQIKEIEERDKLLLSCVF